MKGLGKFFFGGLLGALFGFLVSPKRGQRVRDALLGDSTESAPDFPRLTEASSPDLLAEPASMLFEPPPAPEPAYEAPPAPAPPPPAHESAYEPEPPPAYEPEPAPESEPEPVAAYEAVTEPEAPPEYAVPDEPSDATVTETLVIPKPSGARQARVWDDNAVVVPAPEILEEPIGGPGWATVEGAADSEGTEGRGPVSLGAGGTADLRARIAETRRRIQRELDQPFAPATSGMEEASIFGGAPVMGETQEDAAERAIVYEPPVESFEVPAPVEVEEAYTVTPAPAPYSAPALEPKAVYEPVSTPVEPEPAPPAYEPEPAPHESPAYEPPAPVSPPPAAEPMVAAPPPPAFEPPDAPPVRAARDDDAAIDSLLKEDLTPTPLPDAAGEFDHESMRKRIEATRNRLKAKAFDAMMKGESVLLSRDENPTAPSDIGAGDLDVEPEVAATIETTLTEDDD